MHSQVCRLNRLVVHVRIFNLAEDKNFKNRYTCGLWSLTKKLAQRATEPMSIFSDVCVCVNKGWSFYLSTYFISVRFASLRANSTMSMLRACSGVRMKVGVLVCIVRDQIGYLRVLCVSCLIRYLLRYKKLHFV